MAETKQQGFDLAAVLGGVSNLDTGTQGREQIEYIDIDHIHGDPRNFYALDGIDELASNIEFAGLQQPIRVRPAEAGDGYVIVSGHRRRAALSKLVEDGGERWRLVPCIVERPSGAVDEVEGLVQELRLIYANSDTREMSSADKAKQAERVEILLYQLKEAGVDFPGRMRDHVAEACKVSASKLARLKVIREKLAAKTAKKHYEKGELKEDPAYTLARYPADMQSEIYTKALDSNYGRAQYVTTQEIRSVGDRLVKIDQLTCPAKLGGPGPCIHKAALVTKALEASIHYSSCRCTQCCSGCDNIASCKSACSRLSTEIQKAKAVAKLARDKAHAENMAREKPAIDHIKALWQRIGEARERAGVEIVDLLNAAGYGYLTDSDIARHLRREQGQEEFREQTQLPKGYPNRWTINSLVKVADKLGCSVDYLFCRTEEPQMAAAVAPAPSTSYWHMGTPSESGQYYCQLDNAGVSVDRDVVRWDADRGEWVFGHEWDGLEVHVLGWYPLPAECKEAVPDEA